MTRGFGTITPFGSGFRARIYMPGQGRVGRVLETYELADEWLKAKQREKLGVEIGQTGGTRPAITYAEAMPEALEHFDARRTYTERTRDSRASLAARVLQRWGRLRIADTTPRHLDEYVIRLRDDGYSTSTIRNLLGMLAQVHRYVHAQGYLSRPPAGIELPPQRATSIREGYTPDELRKLVDEARADHDRRALAVILAGIYTGGRASDLAHLRTEDFHAYPKGRPSPFGGREYGFVRFEVRGERSDRPKGARARRVPIDHAETVRILAALPARPGARLFDVVAGDAAAAIVAGVFRRALGTTPQLHRLRHTYGTREAARLPVPELARRMGHQDWRTTQIYVHAAGVDGSRTGHAPRTRSETGKKKRASAR